MKPFPFLPVSDKKLTKTERKEARARIDQYYQKKLAELQKYIYESFREFYAAGKMNVFELDRIIHIYHKQSQELFFFYYIDQNKQMTGLKYYNHIKIVVWWFFPKTPIYRMKKVMFIYKLSVKDRKNFERMNFKFD
ncbi:MAG: hypothetical protein OIN86_06585 [Candidatus Methanoperedens sp.]|nr:hypothetical protein [Candidatus Methanoperedens sp.]CAG0955636.1 hypothetical protein METP1_00432 [Methanosarcinales archaeon]